jgi:hypothetical protein
MVGFTKLKRDERRNKCGFGKAPHRNKAIEGKETP